MINIRERDRGRPISDLTGHLNYGDLDSDVRKVLQTLSSIEREVCTPAGTTFMMRIRPYRSIDNVIDGVVMVFLDITGRRRAGSATERLAPIVEDCFHEIYIMDSETLRFTTVNKSARQNLGYTMGELRRLTPAAIEAQASTSVYGHHIQRLSGKNRQGRSFKTSHRRKDGSQYKVDVRLSCLTDPPLIVANVMDLTARDAG